MSPSTSIQIKELLYIRSPLCTLPQPTASFHPAHPAFSFLFLTADYFNIEETVKEHGKSTEPKDKALEQTAAIQTCLSPSHTG